ncbi:MAG: helix-turn-helix transcriptional regulator [Lachnospiraceae bacterium]|nr:helix-turn-helix transcriptional regulator [Lachnospiraceae bacterium]
MDSIMIGENIKRLRVQKGITQEQLAEAVGVSAVAVSKWERRETLPDISLLPGLAYFFGISIDELMSYDSAKVEREIRGFISEHTKAAEANDLKRCMSLSKAAYRKYPNDYEVMELYMWDLVGGYADNASEVILRHADELEKITDRILEGCLNAFIRNDAYVMKGKILHVQGRTDEALQLYRDHLPDWFQTRGQKSEQLFEKDTPEFKEALQTNITELSRFVMNKLSKQIWFCEEGTAQEKTEKAVKICETLEALRPTVGAKTMDPLISYFAEDTVLKIRYLAGGEETLVGQIRKYTK